MLPHDLLFYTLSFLKGKDQLELLQSHRTYIRYVRPYRMSFLTVPPRFDLLQSYSINTNMIEVIQSASVLPEYMTFSSLKQLCYYNEKEEEQEIKTVPQNVRELIIHGNFRIQRNCFEGEGGAQLKSLTFYPLSNHPQLFDFKFPPNLCEFKVQSKTFIPSFPFPSSLVSLSIANTQTVFLHSFPESLENLSISSTVILRLPPLPKRVHTINFTNSYFCEVFRLPVRLQYLYLTNTNINISTLGLEECGQLKVFVTNSSFLYPILKIKKFPDNLQMISICASDYYNNPLELPEKVKFIPYSH